MHVPARRPLGYCETEDEYIAAVLGHASLDMLPHYRKRSLEQLERESKTEAMSICMVG